MMDDSKADALAIELHRSLFGNMDAYRRAADPEEVLGERMNAARRSAIDMYGPEGAEKILVAYARLAAGKYLESQLAHMCHTDAANQLTRVMVKMSG